MNAPSTRYPGIHEQEQSDNNLNYIASDDEFQKNCLRYSWDGGITAELSRQMPSFLTAYVYPPPLLLIFFGLLFCYAVVPFDLDKNSISKTF